MRKYLLLISGLLLASFGSPALSDAAAGRPVALLPLTTAASDGSQPSTAPRLEPAERALYLAAFEQHVARTYVRAGLPAAGLPLPVYRQALLGFYGLRQQGQLAAGTHTLSIADFSQSSNRERLWVVDVAQGRLLHRTLVAHGKNTGEEYAQSFSNVEGSEQSSLGFYITGPTYEGRHGLSLRLRGVDAGYNTNAESRAIVVHGAEYVSPEFVRQHGRLGRSQGCPALPAGQSAMVIGAIKNGTVLYIHGPSAVSYRSVLLELDAALLGFAAGARLLAG